MKHRERQTEEVVRLLVLFSEVPYIKITADNFKMCHLPHIYVKQQKKLNFVKYKNLQ